MGFGEMSGLDFKEYKFKSTELSNGNKIQFDDFTMLFNSSGEAIQHIAKIYTHSNDFKYEVINETQ